MNRDVIRELLLGHYPQLAVLDCRCWVVGGALRDLLLGVEPSDMDVACEDGRLAAQQFAEAHGARAVQLGRDPLVAWRVTVAGRVFDFAPLLGGALETDLVRRDFTVNAMAFDLCESVIVDPYGGIDDIDAKCVRMVRESNFDDDPLRLIRAVRLATRFGLSIEEKTFDAIRKRAASLATVAVERVQAEMTGILSRPTRHHGVTLLRELGLDRVVFGSPVTDEALAQLQNAPGSDPIVAWTILLRDRGPVGIDEFAARWRWSEEDRRAVRTLLGLRDQLVAMPSSTEIAVLLHDAGRDAAERAAILLDACGMERLAHGVRAVASKEELFSMEAMLDGADISKATGLAAGPAIGRLKTALLKAQIAGTVTTREQAVRFVQAAAASEKSGAGL